MRRTKAEAEQTRQAILAAAIRVFLERGVARATLDEIATAAGVTRGAIYWHFRDKLEIFLALEERIGPPNAEVSAALKSCLAADPGLDPLRELAETIARRAADPREPTSTAATSSPSCGCAASMSTRCCLPCGVAGTDDATLEEQIRAIMKLAKLRGVLAPAWSPAMAARALFLLLNASVEDWLRAPAEVQVVAETMPLLAAFLETIRAPATPGTAPRPPRRFRQVRK